MDIFVKLIDFPIVDIFVKCIIEKSYTHVKLIDFLVVVGSNSDGIVDGFPSDSRCK